ncbi:MAG: hypothetical protein LBC81_03455 [Tannerellaceae bacterium]|jgi:hypothetical protein|nr:hypothetical protein [Tannerellaceae bacterium]
MKKTLLSCLAKAAIALALSCAGDHPNEYLHFAERLIDTQPENALLLLNGVDQTELSAEEYARWCLAMTQAKDKVDAFHTSDTIIRHAVNYFERYRDPCCLARAYYYMGRVSQELQNAPIAQEYYLKAINVGEAARDTVQLSLVYNQLGMLYTYQYAYGDAQIFLNKSLQYLQLLKDTTAQAYVLRNMARNYGLMDSLDRSIECYEEALCLANTLSRPSILSELGDRLIEMKRYDSAYVYLREAVDSADVYDYHTASLVLGRYFVETNRPDSARKYLLDCISSHSLSTRLGTYLCLAKLARESRRYQDYVEYQTQYELLRDSFEAGLHIQKIMQMQSLYNYQKHQQLASKADKQRNKAVRNMLLIAISALSITLCFAIYYARIQIKHRNSAKEKEKIFKRYHATVVEQTRAQIDDNLFAIKELNQKKIEDKKNRDAIDYEIQLLELSNRWILKKLEDQDKAEKDYNESDLFLRIRNPRQLSNITRAEVELIVDIIDGLYPSFRANLIKAFNITSSEDLYICYFIKIKVRKAHIAKILKLSRQAINNRCRRLASETFGTESTHAVLEQVIMAM